MMYFNNKHLGNLISRQSSAELQIKDFCEADLNVPHIQSISSVKGGVQSPKKRFYLNICFKYHEMDIKLTELA